MTTNRIEVDAPPHDVYAVLLDPYAYAKWVVGSKRVRHVDDNWPAPGARFHHTVGAPGVDIKDSSKIIMLATDRRIVLEVRFRPLGIAEVTIELEPFDDGRRTRITMHEHPKSGPVRRWWSWVLTTITYVRNSLSLRRLARLANDHEEPATRD
jgi:uncharacterized protein YndB with AHSA1/START domain